MLAPKEPLYEQARLRGFAEREFRYEVRISEVQDHRYAAYPSLDY
jgi:hypothetical protein